MSGAMTTKSNPLLSEAYRIPFHAIKAEHVEPGIRQALADAQAAVDAVSDEVGAASWDNTLGRLDRALEKLSRRIAPLGHLVSVAETKELRDAYNNILPEISAFWSSIPLDPDLWKRLEAFEDTDEAKALRGIEQRHLNKTVSEFRRAGANLPAERKDRLQALQIELAQTQQKFSENVLDATAAWSLLVTDESRLDGIPEAAKRRFSARASENGNEGWTLTLDYPSVEPILKHCRDSELRREVFVAYTTRTGVSGVSRLRSCRSDGRYRCQGCLVRTRPYGEDTTLLAAGCPATLRSR